MLFSVIILTYNSSKYVLDALKSVRNQTYSGEMELIVSDDASTDDTVKICKKWLVENGHRFASSKVLEVAKNGGVAANCNRGWMASKGEWIKLLAGDDSLLPDCLQNMADYIEGHPLARVITGKREVYRESFNKENFVYVADTDTEAFVGKPQEEQLRMIAAYNGHFPVADSIRRDVLEGMGGYDEHYMFEDLSFAVRFIKERGRYDYIPVPLIAKRSNEDSITGNANKLFLYRYQKDCYRLNRDFLFPFATKRIIFRQRLQWWTIWLFQHLGLNRKLRLNFLLYHTLINGIFAMTKEGL